MCLRASERLAVIRSFAGQALEKGKESLRKGMWIRPGKGCLEADEQWSSLRVGKRKHGYALAEIRRIEPKPALMFLVDMCI